MGIITLADQLNHLLSQKATFYAEHFKAIDNLQQLPPNAHGLNSVLSATHYRPWLEQFALSYRVKGSVAGEATREVDVRALHSMWSQWFFGLQLPPLLLWLFCCPPGSELQRAIAAASSWDNWYFEAHESGRVETFYLLLSPEANYLASVSQLASWEQLLEQLLIPIVERLTCLSPVAAKLHFSHQAYIVHWYLGELSLPDSWREQRIKEIFARPELSLRVNDQPTINPFWRKLRLKDQQSARIVCCLRHKLSCTQMCADCPLDKKPRIHAAQKACG
ncbi:siderophore-iron reductase FhuF [Vibrio metschnikovii]|uniref:siderophore-iron reductase FhuF n=1 Tax=Vibrio metschnikovii TaxID=28172 RepID=UPI001C2FECB0|nr:siderophore-iron reductase FhuF [Vibrio metschnikovii]